MDIKNIKQLDKDKYEIRFSYIDELTQKRRRVRRRITGELTDAIELRDELKSRADNGTLYSSRSDSSRPLSEWIDDYLGHREDVDQIAVSTLQNETAIYRSNIISDIGDWRPAGIELRHLDQLVAEWLDDRKDDGTRYSPTTIRNRVNYLIRFLKWVFKRIGRSTAILGDVDKPSKRKGTSRRGRSLSPDEINQLLDELKPFWAVLAYTLVVTGQRWGSVTALRWQDVNFQEGEITFARSHYHGQVKEGNKSGDIVRIPMPDPLARRLKKHRERMVRNQRPGLETGLVFPARVSDPAEASHNGYIESSSLRKQMHRICERTDLKRCSPHDLRRSHNTLLVEQGVEGTIIRSITGHADQTMTDEYYRGSQSAKSEALKQVVDLVE